MNGRCETCPAEQSCGYKYKPCDCCDQRKFTPKEEPKTTPELSEYGEKFMREHMAQISTPDVFQAFVDGAKFWEFHKTGATMWQSDQNLCLEKAKEKYGEKNV